MLVTPQTGIYVVVGLLSIAAIVALKLSLDQKEKPDRINIIHQQQSNSLKSLYYSLILRFTLIEVFIIRNARFKLHQIFQFALMALLTLVIQNSYFWVWAIGIIFTLVFIICEIYVENLTEKDDHQQEQHKKLNWSRLILYGSFTMLSIIVNSTVAYNILFHSKVDYLKWAYAIGLSLGFDQIFSRPILLFFFCIATKQWKPVQSLKRKYDQLDLLQQSTQNDTISLNVQIESTKINSTTNNLNNNQNNENNPLNLMTPFKTEYFLVEAKSTFDRSKNPSLIEESLENNHNNNNNVRKFLHSDQNIAETPRIISANIDNQISTTKLTAQGCNKLETETPIRALKRRESRSLNNKEQQQKQNSTNNKIQEIQKNDGEKEQQLIREKDVLDDISSILQKRNRRSLLGKKGQTEAQFDILMTIESYFNKDIFHQDQKNNNEPNFEKQHPNHSNSILCDIQESSNKPQEQFSNNLKKMNNQSQVLPLQQNNITSIITTDANFGKQINKKHNNNNIYFYQELNTNQQYKNNNQNLPSSSLFSCDNLLPSKNCKESSPKTISYAFSKDSNLHLPSTDCLMLSNLMQKEQQRLDNYQHTYLNTIEVHTKQSRNKRNNVIRLEESPIKKKNQDFNNNQAIDRQMSIKRSHNHQMSNFQIKQVPKDLEELTEKQNEKNQQIEQSFVNEGGKGYHHNEGKTTLHIKLQQSETNNGGDLEEVDLNSPLKKRKADGVSPQKNKMNQSPQKIQKANQNKKIQKIKRVKNSRRKDLDKSRHMGIPIPESNNQNVCPEIYLEDF